PAVIGVDRTPNQDAVSDYRKMIHEIANFRPTEPIIAKLAEDGHPYRELMEELAMAIANAPAPGPARKAHAPTLPAMFGRLMVVLHMAQVCPYWQGVNPANGETLGVISEKTARMAFELLTKFFLPHATRVYEEFFAKTDRGWQDVRWLANTILVHKL